MQLLDTKYIRKTLNRCAVRLVLLVCAGWIVASRAGAVISDGAVQAPRDSSRMKEKRTAEREALPLGDTLEWAERIVPETPDSLRISLPEADSLSPDMRAIDSLLGAQRRMDSLLLIYGPPLVDSLTGRELSRINVERSRQMLDAVVYSESSDSLVYDLVENKMHLYKDGDIKYGKIEQKAQIMQIDLNTNQLTAKGARDTSDFYIQATFIDDGKEYNMDSMSYNMDSERAKIRGARFQEDEGFISGGELKKMEDDVINIKNATYTTCDAEHPHFYLASTKAQLIDTKKGKRIVVGPSYLVLEDVPLPLFLPFAFFPIMSNQNAGVIIPEFGEESQKGFFLRNGGYYFVLGQHADLAIRGGIYTLGSWNVNAASNYRKRYKFAGNFSFDYSKDIIGDKGSSDYRNMSNYRLAWTHQQDPKFRPSSAFSAQVNFSSSNYNKYDGNMNDYISAQTNSSIAYSKTWVGTPFSMTVNMQHSQNNRDSAVLLTLPNFSFNVSRIYPFQKKLRSGKLKWYEKISFSYSNTFQNSISTKQNEMFSSKMFDNMKLGMRHQIPVNTSFSLFKFLNISPSATYTERWYFDRISKEWDPDQQRVVTTDTTNGFYRVYNYSFSVGLSTILYGMYTFKNPNGPVKAIRHMITPTLSASYTPDFGKAKYGYYKPVQTNAQGDIGYYSPYENGIYSVPGRGANAGLSFSLANTIEMKVRSRRDSTGERKVKVLESLNMNASYNFMADSMRLSPITFNARTTLFKSLGITANATLDPYKYDRNGRRTKQYSIGRITSASLSFGYSFRSVLGYAGEGSGTGSETLPRSLTPDEQRRIAEGHIDPATANAMLQPGGYYNFSVPWNLTLNYNLSYSHTSNKKNLTQTLGFNGRVNLTKKWGVSVNGGFDFTSKKLTPGTVMITRNLHCWQMDLSWVPIGFRKSWSFNIRVNSSVLSDLKYKKSSGYLDNYYNY